MAEKKDDKKKAKIVALKVKGCDLVREQGKIRTALDQNVKATEQVFNQIEQLEKEK